MFFNIKQVDTRINIMNLFFFNITLINYSIFYTLLYKLGIIYYYSVISNNLYTSLGIWYLFIIT